MKKKFLIVTTVPISLKFFKGQINELKQIFEVELVSSPGKNLTEICELERVVANPVTMAREISFFKDVLSLVKLTILFINKKPYIVHGNTPKGGLLSMLAAFLTRVPIRVYYVHGLRYQGSHGIKKTILILMERISCHLATDIYAVSIGIKSVLSVDRITEKMIKVIGNGSVNGIDVDFFSQNHPEIRDLKGDYWLDDSNFIYGFVGRLTKDKGIHELIQAFLLVHSHRPESRLLIVGEFEFGDPVDEVTKSIIRTNNNIIHVGFQSDVRSFLRIMNVFVLPSYREGFGVSLIEAAAMNVPSIASNISGCNEIIKDGYNGILIEPRSVPQLYDAMIKLISDGKLLSKMSLHCREHIIKKYEQKYVWRNTVNSYHNLLMI